MSCCYNFANFSTLWRGTPLLSFFFADISKDLVFAVFGTPVYTSFPHVLWKFQTQVTQGQVNRSRQVTSPQKSLKARHSYTEWPITLKLLPIDIRNSICKMCISEVWYRWPKVRSVLWPQIIGMCQKEKIERSMFWTKPILNTLKRRVTDRIDILNREIATSGPSSWPQGHFRSW